MELSEEGIEMPKRFRIHLTNEEYNLLNKISIQTKMDWFWLDTDREGFDCVKDLEKGYKITLRFAVAQLNEGIIPELLNLTTEEITTYRQLMQKLKLSNPFEEEFKC
jgi:hypothetical protein